ncbi:MAG: hypothetical protein JWO88_2978 [Frankiales bacterium]|nr:hypothetical protein [Frankiales bacterium]
MISKKKLAVSLASVASMFLFTGTTLGIGAAQASNDTVACTVNGAVNISPGVEGTGTHANHFAFSQATLSCSGGPGNDDAGNYTNVSASGNTKGIATTYEDCAQGQSDGDATITASGPEGAASGTFTFTRTGTVVKVDGSFTAGGHAHTFKATLQFTPTTGTCGVTPVTAASITGTAVITEA